LGGGGGGNISADGENHRGTAKQENPAFMAMGRGGHTRKNAGRRERLFRFFDQLPFRLPGRTVVRLVKWSVRGFRTPRRSHAMEGPRATWFVPFEEDTQLPRFRPGRPLQAGPSGEPRVLPPGRARGERTPRFSGGGPRFLGRKGGVPSSGRPKKGPPPHTHPKKKNQTWAGPPGFNVADHLETQNSGGPEALGPRSYYLRAQINRVQPFPCGPDRFGFEGSENRRCCRPLGARRTETR